MVLYVCNVFTLAMILERVDPHTSCSLAVSELHPADVVELMANAKSHGVPIVHAWGHPQSLALAQATLPLDSVRLECARVNVSLDVADGDELLVGQYVGPRLPEGVTVLPEGARFRWLLVHGLILSRISD